MNDITLNDLQADVQGRLAFTTLADYINTCKSFLQIVQETQPTRIISPSNHNYIFYQYDQLFAYRITRPEMVTNERLREQVRDFQQFLIHDMWTLSQE